MIFVLTLCAIGVIVLLIVGIMAETREFPLNDIEDEVMDHESVIIDLLIDEDDTPSKPRLVSDDSKIIDMQNKIIKEIRRLIE